MKGDTGFSAQSRPKLIVLDLRSIGAAENLSDLSPQEFVNTLWTAAIETGLPHVVVAGGGDIMPRDMEDVYPPHVTSVEDPESALDCLSALRRVGPRLADLSRTAQDVIWTSYSNGPSKVLKDARYCPMQDAIPTLRKLSDRYRHAALNGAPTEAEMAHMILLPLDLDLGSLGDSHLIASRGRLVFDAILLVERPVEVAGFSGQQSSLPSVSNYYLGRLS